MAKEPTKLYMNDMTQQKMYKIFGLRKVAKIQALEDWLTDLPEISEFEKSVANFYQKQLIEKIDSWNEQELSLGFIGPILNLIPFDIPYRLNLFAQRSLSATIGDYQLMGKPDGILASGFHEPEIPYFSFHEYKRDIDSSGDPAGQNLAAMLVGQILNKNDNIIYGCYIVGRYWYFMILRDKEFAISKSYAADDDEIFEIIKILKALRSILFKQIGITE